jgi:hypothetical protein
VKKLLLFIVLLILFVCGVAFWAYQGVVAAGANPIEVPGSAADPKVAAAVNQKLGALPAPAPSASPAAPQGLVLTNDELTELLSRLAPAIEKLKMHVEVADSSAHLRASVPSSELLRFLRPHLGSTISSMAEAVTWVNLDVRAQVSLAERKFKMTVQEVKQPPYLSAARLQSVLDSYLAERPAKAVLSRRGEPPFELVGLELKGSTANAVVQRVAP